MVGRMREERIKGSIGEVVNTMDLSQSAASATGATHQLVHDPPIIMTTVLVRVIYLNSSMLLPLG